MLQRIFSRFRAWFLKNSYPHMFIGRSIFRLSLNNFIRALRIFFEPRYRQSDSLGIKSLKNTKLHKSAIVLGNGPSLNFLNVEKVQEQHLDVFVVNDYYLTQIAKKLTPTFYVLSDTESFATDDPQTAFSPINLAKYLIDSNAELFLPHFAPRDVFEKQIPQLFFDDREGSWLSKNINPTKPRGYTSVTAYKALALAIYMGYEKVFILGIDNTEFCAYQGTPSNRIIATRKMYAEEDSDLKSNALNMTNVFQDGIAGRMSSYSLLFGDLRKFPKEKIVNLNENSLIDDFPKPINHPLVARY